MANPGGSQWRALDWCSAANVWTEHNFVSILSWHETEHNAYEICINLLHECLIEKAFLLYYK